MTNSHCYCIKVFYNVLDMQLLELNSRFNEVITKLLLCVSCLNPYNSFEAFSVETLVQLARFYPDDFQEIEHLALSDQLENFRHDMILYTDTSVLRELVI